MSGIQHDISEPVSLQEKTVSGSWRYREGLSYKKEHM